MSETSVSDKLDNDNLRTPTEKMETCHDAQTNITEHFLETSDKKRETTDLNANVITNENSNPDSVSLNEKAELPNPKIETGSSNAAPQGPVTVSLLTSSTSASSEAAPKVMVGPAQIKSTTPVVVGARVVTSSVQGPGATSLALVPQPGRVSVAISQPRVTTLTTARGPVMTLPRISTPSQSVPMTRSPQTVPLQLPANFQVPQGELLCDINVFVLVYCRL